MVHKVVECVPNFSEGRDLAKIKQITDVIEAVQGVTLLGVEPGAETNRTVVTFVGSPDAVAEAAFQAIGKAAQVIDMSVQHGTHPRMGATDVCPFVPVEGVTMDECVAIAKKVGERVGRELEIPIYLYEYAASRPEWRNLATIRKGEYEALAQKLQDSAWKPDFGPARFNARAGATVIGARDFLIAYNITLNSSDKNHATDIAFELREKGRVARAGGAGPYYFKGDLLFYEEGKLPCGNCDFVGKTREELLAHCSQVHGYDLVALLKANGVDSEKLPGKKVHRSGLYRECKAIGWVVPEFGRAQISINLTKPDVTPPHVVLDAARELARERSLVVTGSEVVGLIPYKYLLEAGRHYLRAQGRTAGLPVRDVLNTAVYSMGLADVAPFEIEKKVIGLPAVPANALADMTLRAFTDEVSRDSPAPGGGSIAAHAGALGSALAAMVANLTHGKAGSESKDDALSGIGQISQEIKDKLIAGIDDDTNAFNAYMEARRLPAGTPEEKSHRECQMQEGLKVAVDVPWKTACLSLEAMKQARHAAEIGNVNSITDAAVGVQMGYAGVRGGVWNVLINLKDINDSQYVQAMQKKCSSLVEDASALLCEATGLVDSRIGELIAKGVSAKL